MHWQDTCILSNKKVTIFFAFPQDKTFGLKNKKGGKQQKFIHHVQKQVTHGNKSGREVSNTGTLLYKKHNFD
jgi:hypothetical protein